MKLLKTSLLLAAAATQLEATDFRLTYTPILTGPWANGTNLGASATGIVGIDTSLIPSPGSDSSAAAPAWLTSFSLTVSGVTGSASNLNGTYTLADVNNVSWSSSSAINFTSQIIGQSGFGWFSYNLKTRSTGPHSHGAGDSELYDTNHELNLELTSFILAGPSGVTDFADWMSSVNNQNRVYAAGTTLASLPLEGAHHRPMMSFDRMGKDAQFWATGDFGSSSRVRDVKLTSGEMGVNKDIAPNALAGIAIGRGQQNQDLALDGSNNGHRQLRPRRDRLPPLRQPVDRLPPRHGRLVGRQDQPRLQQRRRHRLLPRRDRHHQPLGSPARRRPGALLRRRLRLLALRLLRRDPDRGRSLHRSRRRPPRQL